MKNCFCSLRSLRLCVKYRKLSCVTPNGVKITWLILILGFTLQAMLCHPKRGWIENDCSDTIMPHIHEKYVVNMYHYIIS